MRKTDNANTNIRKEKIDAKELLRDIKVLLKDNLIAKLYEQGQEVSITFLNGQKFILTLYEVNG